MKKIRVVWMCSFSNKAIRERLVISVNPLEKAIRHIMKKQIPLRAADGGAWINNALEEVVKFDKVELHVITPCLYLKKRTQKFCIDGVNYYFIRDQSSSLSSFLWKNILKKQDNEYHTNSKIICQLVENINPDIIHLFGAENPNYSLASISIPHRYPIIVQLQTLVNEPKFLNDYYKGDYRLWHYYSSVEKRVIERADYVGTQVSAFIEYINKEMNLNKKIVETNLAICNKIYRTEEKKDYDCVYFAKDISKSVDLAIEAFSIAQKRHPSLTLLIIGYSSPSLKNDLQKQIDRLGISENVEFSGLLPSYEEVITLIRKSKIALLPLKVDLITSTIRESMSNGIPVVTTDTGESGTQRLNLKRKCVLISKIGDSQSMADNILRLINDRGLYELLRENSFVSREELDSNYLIVKKWIETYNNILNYDRVIK